MRSLKFGVLVSSGIASVPPAENPEFRPWQATEAGISRICATSIDHRSGHDLATALRRLGHRARVIPTDEHLARALTGAEIPGEGGVDACILALHGDTGGSGHVQALLDRLGIPYAGARPDVAALAYDKLGARELLARHNVPVPTTVDLSSDDPGLAARMIGWPAVLKPRRGSHGNGVSVLSCREEVEATLRHRDLFTDPHLLERRVEGVEVQVVLLGGRVLGAMQIERAEHSPGEPCAIMTCPPDLTQSALRGVHNLARHAAAALGIRDELARVDVLVNMRHNEVVLEVEPLPALHKGSVVALVARAAGLSHAQLVARVVHTIPGLAERMAAPATTSSFAPLRA